MEHISLSELNTRIKKTLEKELSPSYWVVAEISEIRVNPNGHCYLELVEKIDNKIIAKTKATIWSYTYSNLSIWFERMTGQTLKGGMKILFNAAVQYHEVFGLSLNIKDIDATYTIGERELKRQQVIAQLEDEGVLEMNKELSLPIAPQRLAVISSETAAGYGDFRNQLVNNPYDYSFHIKLFQAAMQGDNSPSSITKALHHINKNVDNFDLVVVIRGGGSQLDLDCFDDYELNAHLAQFPLPVITGIGHERDQTIADIVAHTTLKTPTAVAEFLISGVRSFEESMLNLLKYILNYSTEYLSNYATQLTQLVQKLASNAQSKILNQNNKLSLLNQQLQYVTTHLLKTEVNKLDKLENKIYLLSPKTILKRGYTLSSINNKLIKTAPKQGEIMVTETYTNKITSTINEITKK